MHISIIVGIVLAVAIIAYYFLAGKNITRGQNVEFERSASNVSKDVVSVRRKFEHFEWVKGVICLVLFGITAYLFSIHTNFTYLPLIVLIVLIILPDISLFFSMQSGNVSDRH